MTVKYRKYFYIASAALVLISVASLLIFRIPLGIDFKGGSLMEIQFHPIAQEGEEPPKEADVPTRDEFQGVFNELGIGSVQVQVSENDTALLRFSDITEEKHNELITKIDGITESDFEETRFDSVGPVIGQETARSSMEAIVVVIAMIIIYIAWAFRKIHQPIGSVRYGFIAVAALVHDITITAGIFSLYAKFTGTEVGVAFVAALLTILGYSVNDTIIIFDRIRENLTKFGSRIGFDEIVSRSIKENLVRTINTSLTTLFVLTAILVFGGATIRDFVFTLIIGVAIGTYSSIALASPLLVSWASRRKAA